MSARMAVRSHQENEMRNYRQAAKDHDERRKGDWMQEFEDAVVAALPAAAGKIYWDDANYHYNQGRLAQEAADKYVASHFADARYQVAA